MDEFLLTFDNFGDVIDHQILERGRDYYKSGHVTDLEEVEDGAWQAVVAGTEDYDVVIEQDEEGLLCTCTCPYDWGPYCKHVVAVLFAIRAETKGGKARQKEKKQQKESVKAVLERLSHEQLVALLMEQIKKDKSLANQITLQFSQDEPGKAMYARIVQDSLRQGMGRDGFIDYASGRRAAKGVWELLNRAKALIDGGQAHKVIPLLQAVIETMTPALQYADDSDGEISGCIEEAFEHLERAARQLDSGQKTDLFAYCLSEAFEEQYQGWDSGWTFLMQAADLVTTRQQREALFAAADRMAAQRGERHPDLRHYEFDDARAIHLKLSVMEREDSPQEIHDFLLKHVHLSDVRKQLIALYIEQKQYAAAAKLCQEGIDRYKHLPGLVNDFQRLLLEIAEHEGSTEKVVEFAGKLMLESHEFDLYYDKLKKAVPASQWPAFVEGLIARVTKQQANTWYAPRLLAALYAREGMWERLLNVAQGGDLNVLHQYGEQLEKRFPVELCAIYERIVYKGLEHSSSRDRYREMCAHIKHIKKLGQREQAEAIVERLKASYPQRRAMLEELAKV